MRKYNEKKIIVLTTHHNSMLIEKIFASFDTKLEVIYELHKIMDCFVKDWHFGILIDNDYIKSMSNLEKPMLEKYINFVTTAYFTVDSANRSVVIELKDGSVISPEEFVEACISAGPRKFRSEPRLPIHLNAIVSRKKSRPEKLDTFKTFTLNLSLSGCFVYANEEYEIDSQVLIEFAELVDKTPIIATVQYQLKWGTPLKVAGLGLEFVSITERQISELKYYVSQF